MSRFGVMVDLETCDTRGTAAILSIGAVMMDMELLKVVDRFYIVIDPETGYEIGLTKSEETLKWWSQQSAEARKVWDDPSKVTTLEGMVAFAKWANSSPDGSKIEMWGNGSDFDNVILIHAYDKLNFEAPWQFFRNRCYRTLRSLYPQVKHVKLGTHHNALDDAESQAATLFKIMAIHKTRTAK